MKGDCKMKKFNIVFLILVCLLFNMIMTIPASAINTFKEGIYQLSDLNISSGNNYTIQNTSPKETVFMIIFDENQYELQSIHLSPQSINYRLIPLEPTYRIVIIGNAEVTIS